MSCQYWFKRDTCNSSAVLSLDFFVFNSAGSPHNLFKFQLKLCETNYATCLVFFHNKPHLIFRAQNPISKNALQLIFPWPSSKNIRLVEHSGGGVPTDPINKVALCFLFLSLYNFPTEEADFRHGGVAAFKTKIIPETNNCLPSQ